MYKLNVRKIINNLTKSDESLTQRVFVSGFWIFTLRILQKAFGLIRLIVLARVVAPDDFGLMGIALLTMSILETFSQSGFQHALIHKKENIDSYLNSAWTFLILRGFMLFGILYLIAPYAATFFNASEAKSVIQVIGISVLIKAFNNLGVIYFKKDLEFNKQFIYEMGGTLADFIVSVSTALILMNAWALVFGLLAGEFSRCCLSYLLHPRRPRLNFDLGKLRELWGFGKWISGSNIFTFLVTQGDDIFVGKVLGATALGFYQMAYRISNLPATDITHVISQITFPAYSKLQDNLDHLRKAHLQSLQSISFLSFPIAAGILAISPEFVRLFLGEQWNPIIPPTQVLAVYGAVRSIGAANGALFYGTGNPRYDALIAGIKFVCLAIIIYPLAKIWGITGTAIATTLPVFLSQSYGISKVLNILHYRLEDYFRPLVIPFLGSLLILSAVFTIKMILTSDRLILILGVVVSSILYLSFLIVIGRLYKQHNILITTLERFIL